MSNTQLLNGGQLVSESHQSIRRLYDLHRIICNKQQNGYIALLENMQSYPHRLTDSRLLPTLTLPLTLSLNPSLDLLTSLLL